MVIVYVGAGIQYYCEIPTAIVNRYRSSLTDSFMHQEPASHAHGFRINAAAVATARRTVRFDFAARFCYWTAGSSACVRKRRTAG
jgi:hypothetical protein